MAKILVIDDELYVVTSLQKLLEAHKHNVLITCSGEEGILKARQEKPDLILLDILMPPPNGYEVLKRLKEDAETKSIPVVMLTVRRGIEDVVKSVGESFAADFISKPYTVETLLNTITQVLRGGE
jgi:two-component system alkaline phosphatase synthesis response regulator PhoP